MKTEEEISTAGADFTKLQQLTAKLDELNHEYEDLIERWSYLRGNCKWIGENDNENFNN